MHADVTPTWINARVDRKNIRAHAGRTDDLSRDWLNRALRKIDAIRERIEVCQLIDEEVRDAIIERNIRAHSANQRLDGR